MTDVDKRVPGPNESDPLMIRERSFQGGADGIGPRATKQWTYGDVRYADGEGPNANMKLPQGAGSMMGLPQLNAGNIPPLWDEKSEHKPPLRISPDE